MNQGVGREIHIHTYTHSTSGRVNEFICVFHERLIDCGWQDWKIMFKLVTDLVCTEVLIAFRIVPKHI